MKKKKNERKAPLQALKVSRRWSHQGGPSNFKAPQLKKGNQQNPTLFFAHQSIKSAFGQTATITSNTIPLAHNSARYHKSHVCLSQLLMHNLPRHQFNLPRFLALSHLCRKPRSEQSCARPDPAVRHRISLAEVLHRWVGHADGAIALVPDPAFAPR